jgi:hypothetical protein
VKDTGNNTQGRVDCFSSQVAIRYYESVLLDIAKKTSDRKAIERYELVQTTKTKKDKEDAPTGIFVLTVNDPTPEGNFTTYQCRWKKKDKKRARCDVPYYFVKTLTIFMFSQGYTQGYDMDCYNSCVLNLEGREVIFRSSSSYMGDQWYDWCLFKSRIDNKKMSRAGRILGFILLKKAYFAIVQKSIKSVKMDVLQEEFIMQFQFSGNPEKDYCVVPIKQITHPLYVFENHGGSMNEYYCSIPRRCWGKYFGDRINRKNPN